MIEGRRVHRPFKPPVCRVRYYRQEHPIPILQEGVNLYENPHPVPSSSGLAALIVPACASDRARPSPRSRPGWGWPRPRWPPADGPKTASAPLGYPWATGASLPTATAKAPGNEIR